MPLSNGPYILCLTDSHQEISFVLVSPDTNQFTENKLTVNSGFTQLEMNDCIITNMIFIDESISKEEAKADMHNPGPRAESGPPRHFIRPAENKIM